MCIHIYHSRVHLLRHYRAKHSICSKVSPLPCVYPDCPCTFPTHSALKTHLHRNHVVDTGTCQSQTNISFKCSLCTLEQSISEDALFSHLRAHLKSHETVVCPYKSCNYSTNVYSSFNAHKSRVHHGGCLSDLQEGVGHPDTQPLYFTSGACNVSEEPESNTNDDNEDIEDIDDVNALRNQLKHNVASLFLKMQAILHISNMATNEIIEDLSDIYVLSQPLIRKTVSDVLQKHGYNVSAVTMDELVSAVMDCNILFSETSEGAELSSFKRRKTFIEHNYPVVMPLQYDLQQSESFSTYVPVLSMIQSLFRNSDILTKITAENSEVGCYRSYVDGTYYRENELLSAEELRLSLQLYVDDLEIANPLGTARKIHKLCAVYWTLANLHPKYRSALHSIQLAVLCKVTDIQTYGYPTVLAPLLHDLQTLESDGVFIDSVGHNVKGTVFCVSADNLAAHGLAGFVESFRAGNICRFCLATSEEVQVSSVSDGTFVRRTKAEHDLHVQKVMHNDSVYSLCGVKRDCVLRQSLTHFHPITGFPPDILHDLLEGIVPAELCLCIKEMIQLQHFTLEWLNQKIMSFPYQFSDKVDKPKPLPKTLMSKGTIGGNGHENATLLRLLPLLIGNAVPKTSGPWAVLMELKDLVELAMCPLFTEEMLDYLSCKIDEHRQTLKEVFPEWRLRPKHHYVEHYADLIKCFGPLVHLWTMRFEGKHRFFKRVVHDAQNFKNILKTMAVRHQYMIAYHLSSGSFFKPKIQTSAVNSVSVSSLPDIAQMCIKKQTDSDSVFRTLKVTVDGTEYANGMFVSVGESGGLPKFAKILQIYLVNNKVSFFCTDYDCWYIEHLRCYELCPPVLGHCQSFYLHSQLNDTVTLCAYRIEGRLLLTTKRFLPVTHNGGM